MNTPSQSALKSIATATLRHAMTALGAFLVSRWAINPSTAQSMTEALSGLAMALFGYGWSLAHAGKLGEQAKTICELLDRLAFSLPVSALSSGSSGAPGEVNTSGAPGPINTYYDHNGTGEVNTSGGPTTITNPVVPSSNIPPA